MESKRDFPLVTIAITCFNAESTIAAAIAGAAAQTYPHLEIVVADDASSDRSRDIVHDFAARDPRVRLVVHEINRGYAGALNSIIGAARGDFIAVFDDDDVSVPDRIERQLGRLTGYERSAGTRRVLCYSNREVVLNGARGEPVRAMGRTAPEPHGSEVVDFLLWHREAAPFVWGQLGSCTLFARTATLREIGAFDEGFRRGAEWDFAVRHALADGHFIAVDAPLIAQYKTLSADKSGKIPLTYMLRLRRKYAHNLRARGLYPASVAMAHARFHYARGERARSYLFLGLACLCSPFHVLPSEVRKWKRSRELTLRSVARNAGIMFALRALQHGLRLAMLYIVVRALSTEQFGRYQFVLTCVALAAVCALPGLNNSLMQSVARGSPGAYRPAVRLAFRASFLGTAVLAALAWWHARTPGSELAPGFLVAATLFPFAYGLEQWKALRAGLEDFAAVFRIEAVTALVLAAAMIAAVTTWPGSIIVPLAVLFGVAAGANTYQTVRTHGRIPRDTAYQGGVLGHGVRMTIYSSLNTLANQVDKILVYAFLSPASLAIFVAAERIPEMTKNAVQDLAAVLAPRFAKRSQYDDRLDRSLRALGIAIGLTIFAAAFLVLPWLVSLVFGDAYRDSIPYAQALMCTVAVGNVATLRFRYVTSKLDESGPRTVNIAMSAARIAASAVLVPWLGLLGAVISTAIYRIVTVVVVDAVIRRRYLRSEGVTR